MTTKEIVFDNEAREKIGRGVDALANAVKVTLGPRGRNVILERAWGAPTITKDGEAVARELELEDHFANMGVQMVKEVASRTAEIAGDGTTTATVLAQAIYREGVKLVTAGANPMDLKRGIDIAVGAIVADLTTKSRAVESREQVAQVGTVSANGDATVGELIADAMHRVGNDGVVTLEESRSIETTLEVVEGSQFDRGYLSPYFVTDTHRLEASLENALVLTADNRLSNLRELLPLLEMVAKANRPLLVIAESVSDEALTALMLNKIRGALKVCAVKAPGFGDNRTEMLRDISAVLGGKCFTQDQGEKLENLRFEDLGQAKRVIVSKDSTVLVGGAGKEPEIAGRVRQIRARLEEVSSDAERDVLRKRLAKLAGGVAVIAVGAATESELQEKKARVEDALHATRAAVKEGISPGGGVALLRSRSALDALSLSRDEQFGVQLVRRAVEEPLRQIAKNGGAEGAVVLAEVMKRSGAEGYNAASERYEDLVAAGIVDATQVVRVALENAASIASLLLTTRAMVGFLEH